MAFVDGEPVEQAATVIEGIHWVSLSCDGQMGPPSRVDAVAGETLALDLAPEPEPEPEPPAPGAGGKELLVDLEQPGPVPWYGDGWNLALETGGVLLLGLGAGLLGGSLQVEQKALRAHSLRYVGLEQRALDMEVSGWVLLGAGAVALTVGMVRMSRTGGDG
jgi:hypothetical protein